MSKNKNINLGDKVYMVREMVYANFAKCEDCNGVGQIILPVTKTKVTCPICSGQKELRLPDRPVPQTLGPYTVGCITTRKCIPEYSKENYTEYMLVETGIGSGSVYHLNDFFTNKKEADDFCGKQLKEIPEDTVKKFQEAILIEAEEEIENYK